MGSTHVIEPFSMSLFPSIATFDFDLILGPFLNFWGPNGVFFGVGVEFKNCFGFYSCSCSTFILYVSVNSGIGFYSILGSLLTFWGPNGLFLGMGEGSKTVLGSTYVVEQLSFSMSPSILTFDFDLTFWGPNELVLGLG